MTIEDNRRVALTFIERVFVQGDPAGVDELATEDFTAHTFGPLPPGRESLKAAMARVSQGLTDVEFRVDDVIAEGDRVAVRLTSSATHSGSFMGVPASGRRYAIQEIHIFRIRGGQVAEHWHEFDRATLLRQLQPEGPAS